MIQVNLLREGSLRRGKAANPERRLLVLLVLGPVLLVSAATIWNRKLVASQNDLIARNQELQAEKLRLAAIQAELQRYRQEKSLLDARAAVASGLLANRYGPVNLMNALIASIPDQPLLWLTGLTQNGNRVVIQGNAFDVPSIARFISSLSSHSIFRDVDLDFWEEDETSLKFQLTCFVENK